jgi:hypothetical protein
LGIAHQRWEYVCDYYHTGPEQDPPSRTKISPSTKFATKPSSNCNYRKMISIPFLVCSISRVTPLMIIFL